MTYLGNPDFDHRQNGRIGVLLTNLGTPDTATTGAVRRYLSEFLADPRVVELPRLPWWLILHSFILRVRPARSAKLYASIWTDEGSPLLVNTRKQAEALKVALADSSDEGLVIDFAMRYGNPSIRSVVQDMLAQGVRKLLVVPLYPQYSATTTASTFDALAADFRRRRMLPELRFISHYHDFPPFIAACIEHIRQFRQRHGSADKLLLSYHGLPKKYLLRGDPYYCHCHKTSRLITKGLGLGRDDVLTTFQSRFGREEWLQPYTNETLMSLPRMGVSSVQVFCPGFAADCLETLEEISVENRRYFLEAGGESYAYIEALNDSTGHIAALDSLIRQHLQGWDLPAENSAQRQKRARHLGAAN